MTEKPLHVQVAEAMGCKVRATYGWSFASPPGLDAVRERYRGLNEAKVAEVAKSIVWECACGDALPHGQDEQCPTNDGALETIRSAEIPRYDTDWSATGPLIEQLRISVVAVGGGLLGPREYAAFQDEDAMYLETGTRQVGYAYREDCEPHGPTGSGASPLLAVCNLILALHTAGKLDATLAARAS